MLAFTMIAWTLALRELGHSWLSELAAHRAWTAACQAVFTVIAALLIWGNFVYQLTRFGQLRRSRAHRPSSLEALEQVYEGPERPLVILVPAYKEEIAVVRCALLSAALQEHPARRVLLLIDDPPQPESRADRAALAGLRELPRCLQALFDAAAKPFIEAERAFHSRRARSATVAREELDVLAQLYGRAAVQVQRFSWRAGAGRASERLLEEKVLIPLAQSHRARAERLAATPAADLAALEHEYRRLAALFSVGLAAFERKLYENLPHEPNKAMNLNSYLALLGGRFNEVRRGNHWFLEAAASGSASLIVRAAEFVITLDADSILLPEYALRLVHTMCLPGNERLAVAQTPYSSIPAARGSLEYVAGATTDIQYLVHQGFTAFGATFWVGANALLRTAALEDIKTHDRERGYPIVRYIQDRTVIEDTESSIDLIERGWKLYNYPERLAYSATPPDFGALLIQRRRWANGGLIILPKLLRYLAGAPCWTRLAESYFRSHYLVSIAVVNLGLLILLALPVGNVRESFWLCLTAVPYFVLYGRDLVRMGYRWRDLAHVYALNLLLVPVNLGGVVKSIEQALTGNKIPFGRTPKVAKRTAAPPFYVLAEYALLVMSAFALARDVAAHRWVHALFTASNTAFLGFAIGSYIGWPATLEDLRAGWRARRLASDVWDAAQLPAAGEGSRVPVSSQSRAA